MSLLQAAAAHLAERLWRGPAPGLRAAVLAAVLKHGSASGLGRAIGRRIAEAGGRVLGEDPQAVAAMVRRLEAQGATPLLVAGDSHARLYARSGRRARDWLLVLVHVATGASAAGLANPRSRSGEGAKLTAWLAGAAAAGLRAPVLLVFGQVDVEFVFSFKRLRRDPPAGFDLQAFERFCRETTGAHAAFAATLPAPGAVSLAGLFPPALSDAAWREGYLNAHIAAEHAELSLGEIAERLGRAEIPPLAERTAHHRRFDAALREAAAAHGLSFLDVASALPSDGGAVAPALLGAAAGRDHHLDYAATQPYIIEALWRLAEREPRQYE